MDLTNVVLLKMEDIRHQITWRALPPLQVVELVLHHESLEVEGGAGLLHPEEPGQPLEEHSLHPGGHLVSLHRPLVVVENEDGADDAAGDHHHDAGEVGADEGRVAGWRHHAAHHVHKEGERHQDCDAQSQLLPGLGRRVEAENDHAGYDDAGNDQIVEVVDCLPLNDELESDVKVHLWAAGILDTVPGGEGADQLPLRVLLVTAGVRLLVLHSQVDQSLVVGPRPKLQAAVLLVEGEPSDVHFTGGLEQS